MDMARMIPFLHIVCYKWGTGYSAGEVNILRAMVQRHLTVPHVFHCITDDASGLAEDIKVHDLPRNLPGNGPKIFSFSDGFLGLGPEDYIVSLDVDLVIVGSLDFLAEQPQEDFIITRHPNRRGDYVLHGAVYRLRAGSHRHIWDRFIANPYGNASRFPGVNGNSFSEQLWLEDQIDPEDWRFFPDGKIILFRTDCRAKEPARHINRIIGHVGLSIPSAGWGKARLPGAGEAIVSFAGQTKPHNVLSRPHNRLRHAPFVAEHWHL